MDKRLVQHQSAQDRAWPASVPPRIFRFRSIDRPYIFRATKSWRQRVCAHSHPLGSNLASWQATEGVFSHGGEWSLACLFLPRALAADGYPARPNLARGVLGEWNSPLGAEICGKIALTQMSNPIVAEDLQRIRATLGRTNRFDGAIVLMTGCAGFLGFYLMQFLVQHAAVLGIRKVIGIDTFLLVDPFGSHRLCRIIRTRWRSTTAMWPAPATTGSMARQRLAS